MTFGFTSVNQSVFQADAGSTLADVVSYAATIPVGHVAVQVVLIDLLTGKVVSSTGWILEDPLFGGTISGSLPMASDNLIMPDQPLYLELQLLNWVSLTATQLVQKVDLQPITLPGGGGGGGGSGGTVVPLPLIIAGVAGVGLLAAGIYLLKRH